MKYRTKPVEVEAFQWDGTEAHFHIINKKIGCLSNLLLLTEPNLIIEIVESATSILCVEVNNWIVFDEHDSAFSVYSQDDFPERYEAVQ